MVTIHNSFERFFLENALSDLSDAISLYPTSLTSTISVQITPTELNIKVDNSSGSSTETIEYVGKSLAEVCRLINLSSFPVIANPLMDIPSLEAEDLKQISTFKVVPLEFIARERTSQDRGIVIKTRKFTVKQKSLTSFYLLPPYFQSAYLPWYPRINNTKYTQKLKNKLFHFEISEYNNQTWSIRYGKPIKDVFSEVPRIINARTIQVSRTPLFYDSSNLLVFYADLPISNSLIEDIDYANGFIYYKENLFTNPENIQVTYNYIETSYEYKLVNLNGHFSQSPELLNKFVLIYLVPFEGTNSTKNKRSVYHTIGFSIEECLSKIPVDQSKVPVTVLGAYQIQPVFNPADLSIIDTRSKGGGLYSQSSPIHVTESVNNPLETISRDTILAKQYLDSSNYWDIGRYDGQPYPGSAALVVDIPEYIAGYLDRSTIESKVSKHFAAGIVPLMNYTRRDLPLVTGLNSNISLLLNNTFTSTKNWASFDYELPNNSIYNSTLDYNVQKTIGDGYITITSLTGYFQPYLCSEVHGEATWKERDLIYESNGEITYSEWKLKHLNIIREMPSGKDVVKNYFSLPKSNQAYQVSDIQIHCPIRNNITGNVPLDVIATLSGQYEAYLGLTETLTLPDSTKVTGLVQSYISNISTLETSLESDYIGTHESNRFIRDSIHTNLVDTYSGRINDLSHNVAAFITSTGLRFFSPEGNSLEDFSVTSTGSVDTVLEDFGSILHWLDLNDPSRRPALASNVFSFISLYLDNESFLGYPYIDYSFKFPGTATPIPIQLGESIGYTTSETKLDLNEDHRLFRCYPGICSLSTSDLSVSGEMSGCATFFQNSFEAIPTLIDRTLDGVLQPFYFENSQIMTGWFTSFSRYSRTVSRVTSDLIDSYTHLKSGLNYNGYFTGNVDLTGLSSSRTSNVIIEKDLYHIMSGLENILESCYSYATDYLLEGGLLEDGIEDLIYAYGWYANNAENYYSLTTSELPTGTIANYSRLYLDSSKTLFKSAVTVNGDIVGTTYLDFGSNIFTKSSPSNIIKALTPGLTLEPELYTIMSRLTLDYLTGYCQNNWYFKNNLNSSSSSATIGYSLSRNLVKMYNESW